MRRIIQDSSLTRTGDRKLPLSKLTIQTISLGLVRVQLPRPLKVSTFDLPGVDTCCVTLRTREGLSGVGWCFAFGAERLRALAAMVRDQFSTLIGKDPRNTEENWAAMRKSVSFVGRDGVSAHAIGALDTACWDIKAKAEGIPLWKLLGGGRTEIPCYASEGFWLNDSVEDLKKEAARLMTLGFAAVKHRVGKPTLEEDIERTRAVREAIGPEKKLMVDANQGWSVEQARAACRELEAFNLEWIEEPVDYEDVRGCAEVVAASNIPVCQGETSYNPRGMRHLLVAGAADVLMADLQRMSGVTGWLKAAEFAREFGKPITSHLFHDVSAHLMSAAPDSIWCEHMPWWEPIIKEPMEMKSGHLVLTEKPGLGIEWDDDAIQKFTHPAGGF